MIQLIADSGATKCEWCLVNGKKKSTILTQGISPYFLHVEDIIALLQKELLPHLKKVQVEVIFYYGTGMANPANQQIMLKAFKHVFGKVKVEIQHDLLAAARALCGQEKGLACILGTGSNSGFYNGKKITANSPGLGFILGDEGSGAYLGKKVVQHYLYQTFDEEMLASFEKTFNTNKLEILDAVYKKPLANRYLASYTQFLVQNRGHFMIDNIIEDGLNDFFFQHLCKYKEVWKYPVHFVGSVAYGFKDVLKQLCHTYEFELGNVLQKPMDGLVKFHQ